MASSDAIRSALVRLCKDGDIIRVAQGIYCYPKIDTKWGSGVVPANVVFFTDGASRKVSVGKGNGILFKHTSEMRTFAYRSKLMLLIVIALREIGEENITEQQMNIIKGHLKNVPMGDFQKDILLAPIWVRKKLQQV